MIEPIVLPSGLSQVGFPLIDEAWIQRRIASGHLPPVTRTTLRFSTFTHRPELEAAWNYCYRYARLLVDRPFLTLAGPPGTGKTHLALAIAWSFLEAGFGHVCYWQVGSFLSAMRDSFDKARSPDSDSSDSINMYVSRCHLVIFDDLGAEHATAWGWSKLDEIIDYRYINRLRTVFTTNVSPSSLSARIADRLIEGKVLVLNAPSYRLTIAAASREEDKCV